MANIINIQDFCKDLEEKIKVIIKDSTVDELCRYIEALPVYDEGRPEPEDDLKTYGMSYINEYYKVAGRLYDSDDEKAKELLYKIYWLYSKEDYTKIHFSFKDFVVFSRLLNTTFTDYNPNKTRKEDKKPFFSGDEDVDEMVNSVISFCNHSEQSHAYEIEAFRLKILFKVLDDRRYKIITSELKKIDFEDLNLNYLLSRKRIEEVQRKMNHRYWW